ncbi:DNA helicase/exodeoxyribonuclease V, beta subunit [Kushneria avicenniae]|uniref:RecBCD enzyme subunit RecB n=1 Tax=Kushneria avicenniae TaxID=402385 RepID=A0A1I1GIX6_9GAMM|nr:exodeoxyribonuclease V subunit beta [Kushneria avicenniae]SFC11405.1 DNA helicase/exodeoxyribonuclease V, beta subunit [Kushneria avicenniae]
MTTSLDIPTLPLRGRRLIEAGAGTGKTFTLAALYVRLVLGHGGDAAYPRPLMPPEILVVTFTEAATEELRDRIRARLRQAREVLLGRADSDPVLDRLLADVADDAREQAASRLDAAARVMDDAAIFTIHGFCQRMLKRHAFDSGALFASELVPDSSALFASLVEDYWRRQFYRQSSARQRLLAQWWETPEALQQEIRLLLHGGRPRALMLGETLINAPASIDEALARLDRSLAQRDEALARLRELWQGAGDEITTLLREAIDSGALNARLFRPADLEARLDAIRQWMIGEHDTPDDTLWDTKGRLWCSSTRLEDGRKKNHVPPVHPFFEALSQFETLAEDQRDQLTRVRAQVLAHARDALAQALDQEKRRRGMWDFDDLLNSLDEALAGPAGARLAERIRRNLPVAMIDEFQDTDPVQYRIFSTIYALPQHTAALALQDSDPLVAGTPEAFELPTALLMIGDPRQAIYAFRGADIDTYLQARRHVDQRYTLDRNFRSTEAMVSAVNRLFATESPFQLEEIPYEAVTAQGRDEMFVEAGEPVEALTCWYMDQASSVRRDDYLDTMATATCADITRLLAGARRGETGFRSSDETFRPLRPADIAILVRTGSEAMRVRQKLLEGGIRSVYLSQKTSVFESREAFHLLQLLEACAHPRNDRSLRAALATRLMSDSLSEVARLEADELEWEAMVERFDGYHRLWQRQGVLPMLRVIMRDFDIPARLLARADGERALTDVLHLGELAQTASARLDGEQALLRWWHQSLAGRFDSGMDPQSLILRLESDDTLVRVITIHKSKGLEYPLVYLPFIADHREVDSKSKTLMLSDETHGASLIMQVSDEQRARADRVRLQEDLRLLYVALTRARYLCRLGVGPIYKGTARKDTPAGATTLSGSALGALLCQHGACSSLDTAILGEVLGALVTPGSIALTAPPSEPERNAAAPEASREVGRARRFTGRIDRNWWVASYTALVEGARQPGDMTRQARDAMLEAQAPGLDLEVLGETSPIPLPPVRRLLDFPRGPRTGTFLHALLEEIDPDRLGELATPDSPYHDELYRLIRQRVQRSTLDPHWVAVLHDWCCAVLTAPLHPNLPGLSLDRLAGWRTELEFWLSAQGVSSARLDHLVRQHEALPGVYPELAPRTLAGMLKGYIDLVIEHDGRFYVIDWKSNHLGDTLEAYDQAAMMASVVSHRYDIQYVLYTLALHRHLKSRLPNYDFDAHLGGVLYLFLRGMTAEGGRGVLYRRPSRALIETLDRLLTEGERALDDESVEPSSIAAGERA